MGKTKTIKRSASEGPPMTPGTTPEPTGPEDALGPGKTRGDYRGKLGDTAEHFSGDEHQNPNVDEIGDTEGLKGGVDTAA